MYTYGILGTRLCKLLTDRELDGVEGSGAQECRDTAIHGTWVQGTWVQGYMGTGVDGYEGTRIQG